MDIRPSPPQQLLIATARDYLRRHGAVEPPKLWRAMAELGWQGLLIPGEFGGSDGSMLDVVLLAEELGYAGVTGPYVTSAVVATSLLMAASPAQQKRVLPTLASGDRIVTLAVVEENGSFDPSKTS